jgi:hypothetical protein
MASRMLKRRKLPKQAEPPEPAGLGIRIVREEEATTALVEPEEVLVADPRGSLTPAQMVQQKLLALLRTGPGLFLPAAGRLQDIRRIPVGPKTPAPFSRTSDATPE